MRRPHTTSRVTTRRAAVPAAASGSTPPPITPQPPPAPPLSSDAAGAGLAGALADPKVVDLMKRVAVGAVTPDAAARAMREMSAGYQQVMDFAAVDAWRADRTGFPEVVWAPGKSAPQIAAILTTIAENDRVALASRVEPDVAAAVTAALGPAAGARVKYNETGRILSLTSTSGRRQPRLPGTAVVISAGTADERVAEECRAVADAMGVYAYRLADVSVDSLHELLQNLPAVRAADVVIVVAGTDGALPAVVAGLVEAPVIAVPTSVGYGAALGGVTPLLSALVASSPGVTVVNIDNGFGAAMVAARILRTAAKLRRVAKTTVVATASG